MTAKDKKIDRRVQYTKMVLKQSLLELMKKEPIGKITVTEICRMADINRNTFYAHYSDPFDLLSQIQDGLFLKIKNSVGKLHKKQTVLGLLEEICEAIADNRELCKIIISEHGDKAFLQRVLYIAYDESMSDWTESKTDPDYEKLELLYAFIANGSIAVIETWLGNDMAQSPAEIARFLEEVTNSGIGAFV